MADEQIAQEYLASVGSRLATDGCGPRWEDWSGAPVLVGRRADFRLRWMGTRLHLFTIAAAVPEITVATIDTFTAQVQRYAKANKGGLPAGMQTGVAVFPLLVSGRIDPAAMAWAVDRQRVQFACLARPVVADVTRRQVGFHRGRPAIGRLYASHLTDKGESYFDCPGWTLI